MTEDRCDTCGASLSVGDYPFCPHGRGMPAAHGDDIPGGQWFENGFDAPQKFYSHSEHRRALQERGCQIVAKYAGPHDRHLTNWAAMMDPYTLEAARVLVSRGPTRAAETATRRPDPDITVTVRSVES